MESALPLQHRYHVDATRAMSEEQCRGYGRAGFRKSNQRTVRYVLRPGPFAFRSRKIG